MDQPGQVNKEIFHTYDVRGLAPQQVNAESSYKIAHAFFSEAPGDRYVLGYDMRSTSPDIVKGILRAAKDAGKHIDSLGKVTTDTMYFAVGKYGYDGGIMVTASHNPKKWNGIKFVKKGVHPVNIERLYELVLEQNIQVPGNIHQLEIQIHPKDIIPEYVEYVLGFITRDNVKPIKIVVDSGNGMSGGQIRKVLAKIPQVELIEMYFEPNSNFPHHEANPVVVSNTAELSEAVLFHKADLGVALDGDGDRCFFVDDKGMFVPAHFTAALLAKSFISKEPGAGIVYDYRNIMALEYEVNKSGGTPLPVKAGNLYSKKAMRENNAVFGSESSGHFYFRDNFFADNGTIALLLMLELLGETGQTMAQAISYYRMEFYSSGEQNFLLKEGVEISAIFQHFKDHFHGEKSSEPDGIIIEFEGWRFNMRPSNTEPIVRLNVEAHSQVQLDKGILEIQEIMSNYGTYQGGQSADNIGKTVEEKFDEIIHNLWFSWNHHHQLPFMDLYGNSWRKTTPPGEFHSEYGKKRFQGVLEASAWKVDQSLRLLNDYLSDSDTWYQKKASHSNAMDYKVLSDHPIAYFSMEYGLIDWLQIYSGGLGVLAGDFTKQASDMGIPMISVGVFYSQGFFHQDLDESGLQIETYLEQNPDKYPIELATNSEGKPVEISVKIIDHDVWVRAWKIKVGRNQLLLLDTNYDRNTHEDDKMITAHLYGGTTDTRLRQEIVLGMGGPRILEQLGYKPSIFHMNEGHSGFLVLELARKYVTESDLSFYEAIHHVRDHLVFTNHTLKQAGNDIFTYPELQRYLAPYIPELKTSFDDVYELGKDQLYSQGKFSMTILGLRNAKISNAVSTLHGKASKKLWPDYSLIPITNGVHMPTWVSPEIHKLLDKYVGEDWHNPVAKVDYAKIFNIPDSLLWEAHLVRKQNLIELINNELGLELSHEALTIAWARRLTAYKRPDLILQDTERLANIVNKTDQPVQILLAGKAHPQDGVGKEMLQNMYKIFSDPKFKNKVQIIPGYNWQLARRMVSGADVWLNTPFRFEEASGTSGMKSAANGVLQLTTLDGWTDEVDWRGKGWVINAENAAGSFYDLLENQIAPSFFSINEQGYNPSWVKQMKASIALVISRYSSQRMMEEYLDKIYMPVLLESPEFNTNKLV